jgi:hypothetical protein
VFDDMLSLQSSIQGHALLVPKAPGYATIIDLPPDVAANVLSELPRLARAVKEATGDINIVQVLIIAGHVFLRMQFCYRYLTMSFSFTATQNNGTSSGL